MSQDIAAQPAKYKIESIIALNYKDKKSAIKRKVMAETGKCSKTYHSWLSIKAGSVKQIPYDAMMCFSRILRVDHTELINQ